MWWKGIAQCALASLAVAAFVGCATDSEDGEQSEESSPAAESSPTEPTATPSTVATTETSEAGLLAPDDSDDLEGDNYEDVVADFEEAGFTNVTTEVIDDLIIGVLVEDGEVEDVSIDGDTDFDNETPYPAEVEVVVTYHTFPEEEDEDDPAPTETEAPEETLTTQNSTDLARLLRGDNCGPSVAKFAQEYADRNLRFDGWISAMAPHEDYDTRYDILIGPGDTNTAVGPSFKFEDVNLSSDLHWSGPNQPNRIGVGDEFTFTVEVDEYVARTCLFYVEPVETQSR